MRSYAEARALRRSRPLPEQFIFFGRAGNRLHLHARDFLRTPMLLVLLPSANEILREEYIYVYILSKKYYNRRGN